MSVGLADSAQKSQNMANDNTLPLWERLQRSLQAYAGIKLNLMSAEQRTHLESTFVRINAIFSKYKMTCYEDYQKMSADDLVQALRIVSDFSASVLSQDQSS